MDVEMDHWDSVMRGLATTERYCFNGLASVYKRDSFLLRGVHIESSRVPSMHPCRSIRVRFSFE